MPRIRSIKPEFWSSPQIGQLDPYWRLLFIAMWNWADDYGRGTCEPRELMGFAFPHDDEMTVEEFRRGLGGIHRVFGVKFYRVAGRSYYLIPTWEKHQKIDKRAKGSKYPSPEEGELFDPVSWQVTSNSEESPDSSEGSPESSMGLSEPSTLEQGNRGTGEQGKYSCSSDDERVIEDTPKEEAKNTTYPDAFEDWWATYPRKVGKRKALAEWKRATKRITPGELVARTRDYAAFHTTEGTDPRYIPHPTTWLRRDGWEDELTPAAQKPASDGNTINAWLGLPDNPNTIDGELVEPSWQSKGELPW